MRPERLIIISEGGSAKGGRLGKDRSTSCPETY